MKQLTKYLFLLLIIISCSDNDQRQSETSDILGKWKLTQQLIDPGDGSGIYIDVTEIKIIEFLSNGNVVSNYSLCTFNQSPETSYTAPYFANENYILPNNCFGEGFNISYQLEGENLILIYPCIEPCLYKFEKTE